MRAWMGVGLGLLVGCAPVADERDYRIEGDFSSVRVELSNGDLAISEVEGDQVLVEVDFGGVSSAGSVSRYLDGDELVIDYACGLCGGDVDVRVPAGMPVRADLQRGDLELSGLSGPVDAEVHAGSVEGDDLQCDVSVFNHIGSIELSWDFRPILVDAVAHVGAIQLEVPAGGYQLDTHANVGVVRLVDVFDDPDSESAIAASAHAGEIAIEGF